jgi:hypothetical protein
MSICIYIYMDDTMEEEGSSKQEEVIVNQVCIYKSVYLSMCICIDICI